MIFMYLSEHNDSYPKALFMRRTRSEARRRRPTIDASVRAMHDAFIDDRHPPAYPVSRALRRAKRRPADPRRASGFGTRSSRRGPDHLECSIEPGAGTFGLGARADALVGAPARMRACRSFVANG